MGPTPLLAVQCRRARRVFLEHGDRYPRSLLFVAGLPKSGTAWPESILALFPGFTWLMIPEAVDWELDHGGSHDFVLPENLRERLEGRLAVLELHSSERAPNIQLLREHSVHYLVRYRDLRDVALSHDFHVRRIPWHPEHAEYRNLDVEERLLHFAHILLGAFVDWIRSWRENRDPELSLVLTYEDLLADTEAMFGEVAEHYRLGASMDRIRKIVHVHSFDSRCGGRSRGEQGRGIFLRKGVAEAWHNYFIDRGRRRFDEEAGDLLDEAGYFEAGF